MMQFIYGSKLSDNIFLDERGQLICRNVKVARDGYQDYLGVEIGLKDDYNVYPVYRPTEEVFKDEVKASFENAPVTEQHPSEQVTVENHQRYAKGFARDIRQENIDGINYLLADLVVTDKVLIDKIQNHSLREISCGYSCNIEESNGEYKQTNIIGNHIAVVDRGRAETTEIIDSKGGNQMLFKKTTKTTETIEEPVTVEDAKSEESKEETPVVEQKDDTPTLVLDAELIELFNNNKDLFKDMCSKKQEEQDSEEEDPEEEKEEKKEVGDSALEAFSKEPKIESKKVEAYDSRKDYWKRQDLIRQKYNNLGGNK